MMCRTIGLLLAGVSAAMVIGQSRMPIGNVKITPPRTNKHFSVSLEANGKGKAQPVKDGEVAHDGDVVVVSGNPNVVVLQFNKQRIQCKSPGATTLKRVPSSAELRAQDDLTKHTVSMDRPEGEGVLGRVEAWPCPSQLFEILLDAPADCRFTIDGLDKVFHFDNRSVDGAFSNPEASSWLKSQEDEFGQRRVTVVWKEKGKEVDADFQLPQKSQDTALAVELSKFDSVTDAYARALKRTSWFVQYRLPFHAAMELRRLDAACPDKRIAQLAAAYLKAAAAKD
jgi:hypothetical protein